MGGTASPPIIDLAECRRLLIVKLSALGDVVHAMPVADALHERFPHLEIDWVVEPLAAPLLKRSPVLSQVHIAPKERRAARFRPAAIRLAVDLHRRLLSRRYDVALDLQGLTKSGYVAWRSGARVRLGYDWLRELSPLFVRRVPRRPESLHIVDQLLDVARRLGAEPSQVRFPIGSCREDDTAAAALVESAGLSAAEPYLVMNPTDGGGGGGKGLLPETMAAVIAEVTGRTGLPWALIGAGGDRDRAEAVVARLHDSPARSRVANLAGMTTIGQLVAVVRRASAHVSGDTGSAHIAAAVGTPPISVHGRSDPRRVGPYGYERFIVNARPHCSERCRRYHERAPINSPAVCRGMPICMASVKAGEIVANVLRALAEAD